MAHQPSAPVDEEAIKQAVLAVLPDIVKSVIAELDRRRSGGGSSGGGGGQKPNVAEQHRRVNEAIDPEFKAF